MERNCQLNRQQRHPSTQNIRRGFCRVMGLIKTTLMLAVEVMAANLRLVREWAKRTGENSDPLHEPFPEDFGFEEIDAEGNLWSVAADDPSPPGSLTADLSLAGPDTSHEALTRSARLSERCRVPLNSRRDRPPTSPELQSGRPAAAPRLS